MGRKLVVEICSAHNLMPKDGQGSASAYCVVAFENLRQKTKVKNKDLNPVWNEKFEFDLSDPEKMDVQVSVYNDRSDGIGEDNFLGRVKILGSWVVKKGEEAIVTYPLEKRNLFSHVRGELRMKIWYYDEKKNEAAAKTEKTVEEKKQESRPSPPTVVFAEEYVLKNTAPMLASITGEKVTAYDLVEKMNFLYVRVVKAKGLAAKDANGSSDPYVKLKIGEGKPAETMVIAKNLNPEWNQSFAFSVEKIQGPVLEITVWDKDTASKDDFLGYVSFELQEIPSRVPPDSPLAPTWYRLEEKAGETRVKGEIMLAVWWGTQADEAFTEAWHSEIGRHHNHTRSKVYLAPKLWYLRVSVIEAQDLVVSNKNRSPEVSVKVQLGIQSAKTRVLLTRNSSPKWVTDDLLFVTAEPFEDQLNVTVEDRVGPGKGDVVGVVKISLNTIERRVDNRVVASRWYNLEKNGNRELIGRIHLRICFDGGYHVMDESSNYISDVRPTARQLWKNPLGILELGIISGQNLLPMKTKDGRGTTDAYCVAKYGPKWVRTRTMVDNFNPKWNEQYTWEVYDPCTVLTVGVFDNCHLLNGEKAAEAKDARIGKVRIRLSTLESESIYTHSYPLMMLQPSGVKKMGEIELAVRISYSSFLNVTQLYFKPLLPKMHYRHPLRHTETEFLKHHAIKILSMRLSRFEPPLHQEVVHYVLDRDSNFFSIRRSKASYVRIIRVFSGILAVAKWFDEVCRWKNPLTTVLVHILFLIMVWYPNLILPTLFLYMFWIGAWRYRFRARAPSSMDATLSQALEVNSDELDEEFDTYPTSKGPDIIKFRYERLRMVASRIQTVLGDLASQGERFQALLSWRDPRATAISITFCLIAAIVLYVIPFQVVIVVVGIYILRHPRFRNPLPPAPLNFFRRLPSLADRIF
ncbi:hypothetical protein O6H91_09G015200 [Diphasiastrum complanatum]|uniref:Uncharacterized protein n=1 Tax=Diphasiastrum complanatum TaxID=34168 RepID=A0ACC2CLN0_DIPCM|nr:hypothetical protein O6H91_09G015200 [Diphasiastrum complanatum]